MTNGEVVQTVWDVSNIKVYKASVFADIYPDKEMRFDKSWWFAEYNGSFDIPKKGRWTKNDWNERRCPFCGWIDSDADMLDMPSNFCPKCGADMRGTDE